MQNIHASTNPLDDINFNNSFPIVIIIFPRPITLFFIKLNMVLCKFQIKLVVSSFSLYSKSSLSKLVILKNALFLLVSCSS